MSQRDSGYERKERDLYETPEWVTLALVPHLRNLGQIWESACGTGKIVDALRQCALHVLGSDIETGFDFLQSGPIAGADAVITNPPYTLAQEFIEHALALMKPRSGIVAMLLRTDFDHARTRSHLFQGCLAFAKKLVLTKRIVWFDRPGAAPSFNHAWYIWDWKHQGPPMLAYGPCHDAPQP
jgi:hypothetical protein